MVLVLSVGALRGLWWAETTQVFSPIDEQAHYDYVARLGSFKPPPVVGKDKLLPEVLRADKESLTSPFVSSPVRAVPGPRWGPADESYEGVQGPLYYALVAPVWRIANVFGFWTSLFALRIATVAIAIAALGFVWLLVGEVMPGNTAAQVMAGLLMASLSGFNANLAIVSNDALATTLSAALFWWLARTLKRHFTDQSAVITGALLGATLLTKSTAIGLYPVVAVALGLALVQRRTTARMAARWLGIAFGVSAVLYAPWVLWNLHAYGATSGASAVDAITGPFQPYVPRTLGGALTHLKSASRGYWDAQLASHDLGRYGTFWFGLTALAVVVAMVRLIRARQGKRALELAWLASAWPLAFVSMLAIIFGVFSGSSSTVGRHLYTSLAATVVALVVATWSAVGRRCAPVILAVAIAGGLVLEVQPDTRYLRDAYERDQLGPLVPVVSQPYGSAAVLATGVRINSPCPVEAVRLFLEDGQPLPSEAMIDSGRAPAETAPVENTRGEAGGATSVFVRLPTPRAVVRIRFASPLLVVVDRARVARVSLLGSAAKDPSLLAYCASSSPAADRFGQLFGPHRLTSSEQVVLAWPRVWSGLGLLVVAAAAETAARDRRRVGQTKSAN